MLAENPKESVVGKRLCVDFDGVLCHNVSEEPYLIPKFPVYAIISARLKEDRVRSEEWLKLNNVKYNYLYLRSSTNVESASFKIQVLRDIHADMFWESNLAEAKQIRKKVGIPVLCIDTMRFV